MNGANPTGTTLMLSVLLGSLLLTSCSSGSAPTTDNQVGELQNEMPSSAKAPAPMSIPAKVPANDAGATSLETAQAVQEVPRRKKPEPKASRPQLIKKAGLTLVVNFLNKSIQQVSAIVRQQQGDLLGLEDQKPPNDSAHHTVSIQIRVPQNQLDTTLDKLTQLGTVQSRTITTEDVADQLVDYQARLRNLQKTETTLLETMERSGSVGDVLKVAQELSNVRQSIEQSGAQLKSLQNQVAYSTISLKLEAAVSTTIPERSLGSQIQETWNTSTHSVSEFTISLLRLGIWLIVYSPYLLLLAAAITGYIKLQKSNSRSITQTPEPPNVD